MKLYDNTKVCLMASGRVYWTGSWAEYKSSTEENLNELEKSLFENGHCATSALITIFVKGRVSFRADIRRKGAMVESVYRKNPNSLAELAKRKLETPMSTCPSIAADIFMCVSPSYQTTFKKWELVRYIPFAEEYPNNERLSLLRKEQNEK